MNKKVLKICSAILIALIILFIWISSAQSKYLIVSDLKNRNVMVSLNHQVDGDIVLELVTQEKIIELVNDKQYKETLKVSQLDTENHIRISIIYEDGMSLPLDLYLMIDGNQTSFIHNNNKNYLIDERTVKSLRHLIKSFSGERYFN